MLEKYLATPVIAKINAYSFLHKYRIVMLSCKKSCL